MIRHKYIDFFIELFIILIGLRNILLFLGAGGLASIVFYFTYIVNAIVIFMITYQTIKEPVRANLFFLASIAIIIALIYIPMTYGLSIWLDNGYMAISFLLTVIFIIVSKKVVISTYTIEICYKVALMQSLFAILCSLIPSNYQYGVLVMHMGNPNQTAIVLWSVFSFCFLYWSKKKHSHRRSLGIWILMIGLIALIYLTKCRTILLSFLITIILYFWIKRMPKSKSIQAIVQIILLISPIAIPIGILTLTSILPSNISIFGKLIFSGRESIWKKIIETFLAHPFLSHLNESPYTRNILQNGTVGSISMGAHNGVLAVLWYYGLIVTILIIYIIAYRVLEVKRCSETSFNACVTYILIIATIFTLSFEEGMLLGNICTTFILPIFFIIAQSENYLENEK